MSTDGSAAIGDTEGAPELGQVDQDTLLTGPDALTSRDAEEILARGPGQVIVWAGERDSGKTTLTLEFYEHHRRPDPETRFAGSETLLALEERVHPSRAASERVTAFTERTEMDPEGRDLLHLAVVPPQESAGRHLLFADIPGEVFRELRDNQLSPDDVPLLARADKLGLCIDGRRLAHPETRPTVASFVRQFLARLDDHDLPHKGTRLALVLTMFDELEASGRPALDYWDARKGLLLEEVRRRDPEAELLVTASRPATSNGAVGMADLTRWLLSEPRTISDPALPAAPQAHGLGSLHTPKRLTR